jgi:hypothetical protein
MSARIVKILVLIFWAAMAVWLVVRQPAFSVQAKEDLASLAAIASQGGPTWSGIYFVDQATGNRFKIGYAKSETLKAKSGYIITSESRLKINTQGKTAQVHVNSKILTDDANHLLSIEFSMLSDAVKFQMFGRAEGGKLHMDIRTAAGSQKQVVDMPPETMLPDTLLTQAIRKGMEVGEVIKLPFFDPTSFSFSEAELTVAEKSPAPGAGNNVVYHLRASYMGMNVEAWVDNEGRTLREQAAMLLTITETQDQALMQGWENGKLPSDLLDAVAVKTERPMQHPRTSSIVKLRIGGIDPADFGFMDQRQKMEGDMLTITVEDMHPSDLRLPINDKEYDKYLASTPTIQVADPAIRSKAREIVGDQRDPLKAAKLIHSWVYKTLEKKPLVSIPSARDVLDIKRGDCNEHATLFTALARSVGIPTRIEVGLVYNNNGFYYHAWNAVWTGQWISIDPTFGQFPSDASHVKVLSGDLDAQIPLMKMIGKLRIEVLEEK